MLDKYLENLEKELKSQNYFDIEDALRQTDNQIRRMKKIGKSEEEIIEELGPIQDYIDNLYVDNCPKSKNEILMNDIIFWGVATPVACLCTLAMIFIAVLCGISGAMYLVKAWTDPIFTTAGMKVGAFVLAICGLVMFGLTGLLTYKIALKMRYGILRHLRLKKYSLNKVNSGEYDDDED
ncbi:MAG TPA: hypothetical protein PLZ09_01855 [Clostridia bacterium]|nr:hypothetical protein [Clostridia bacterium]